MPAAPFLQAANGDYYRFGKLVQGFMLNWYGLIQSEYTLDQYRTIMKAAAQRGILGFRCWGMNSQGASAGNSAGNFVYLNPAGSNLVPNPAFESNSNGWNLGTGYTRSNTRAHGGSWSIKADHDNGFDNLIINDDGVGIAVEPNTDYLFSVYVHCTVNSGNGPIIYVNRDDAYGTTLNATGSLTNSVSYQGQRIFNKVGFTFNSGSATKVWIRVSNNNGDCVTYYDDFNISKLGGSLAFRESTWQAMDRCLAAAREYGLIIRPAFMDNWGGQKGFLNACADQIYGITGVQGGDTKHWDFFTRTNTKTLFKQILAFVAARTNTVDGTSYAQDYALVPELGNELRNDNPTDTNQNTANSSCFTNMGKSGGWIDEMMQYWQPLLPNHLIEATDLGHTWRWFENDPIVGGSQVAGVDYTVTGALASVKSVSINQYILEDSSDFRLRAYAHYLTNNTSAGRSRENLYRQLKDIIDTSRITNGKPVNWAECGIDKRATVVTSMVTYPRWKILREVATMFFKLGGGIFIPWHGTTALFDDNNYNILIDGTLHTGGNANSNLNDNDAKLMKVIEDISRSLTRRTRQITPRQI